LFRKRPQLVSLTNITASREPVQSLSAPISDVLRSSAVTAGAGKAAAEGGKSKGRPKRRTSVSSASVVAAPASLADENESGGGVGQRGGGARSTDPPPSVALQRGARAGAGGGNKRRPVRVSRSADSTLTSDGKENARPRPPKAAPPPLPSSSRSREDLYFQLPSRMANFASVSSRTVEEPKQPFIGVAKFDGPRDGYVFSTGKYGPGYYLDQLPRIEAKMCAHGAFDAILEECMASVQRLSIIRARRVVNALVDSSVEISHYRSEVHWYENRVEERSQALGEGMASAGCHAPARWESWDVVVRELLRLQAQAKQDLAYFKYLNGPDVKEAIALAHGLREEDVGALLELMRDHASGEASGADGKLSMEYKARFLATHAISPRTLKGMDLALRLALASPPPIQRKYLKEDEKSAKRGLDGRGEDWARERAKLSPSVCAACTSLRGRRQCAQCLRERKKLGSSSSAFVRPDSYGGPLANSLAWWDSKRCLASAIGHAEPEVGSEAAGSDEEGHLGIRVTEARVGMSREVLLDMVYRLQYRAARRVFGAWKMHALQGKASRAKDRLKSAKIVTSAFHRWRKLMVLRRQRNEDKAAREAREDGRTDGRSSASASASSGSASGGSSRSSSPKAPPGTTHYAKQDYNAVANISKVGDMIKGK